MDIQIVGIVARLPPAVEAVFYPSCRKPSGKPLAPPAEPAPPASEAVLSAHEEDVLRHTALGRSNKEIAAQLNISTKTVETYKARAVEQLELRSRADILRYGASRGWLTKPQRN